MLAAPALVVSLTLQIMTPVIKEVCVCVRARLRMSVRVCACVLV